MSPSTRATPRAAAGPEGSSEAPAPVAITFLGGLGQIGRNMATLEVDRRIAVIDCGVLFPDAEHLGVDLILPDWRWLVERGDDVDVVLLTHGHLDHIGALPYLLRDLGRSVPVVGSRLTLAFASSLFDEWADVPRPPFIEVEPGGSFRHGAWDLDVVQMAHSIPDGCAFAIRTPHGTVLHTGDFKLDQTPIDGHPTDLAHLARLGDAGVDVLLADSTNADVPGHVPSEASVGAAIREELSHAEGLVVVASFASHVHRIQQVIDAAAEFGRRPVFVGRSMVRNMAIAAELGYLEFDPDRQVLPEDLDRHDPARIVVISTGSQGEPFSALSLIGSGEHKHLSVGEGDVVILASSLIPGNEQAVFRSINNLERRGCRVVHAGNAPVHVSGHANREDLALVHNLIEPEWVVPVHGEARHLRAHARIAVETGCPPDHVLVCEDGDVLLLEDGRVTRGERVPTSHVYIDGLLPDIGPAALRDRRRLGEDGICVAVVTIDDVEGRRVGETIVTQKGVAFGAHVEDLLARARGEVDAELDRLTRERLGDHAAVQRHVTQALGRFWRAETGRRPVILPVVLDL
jgi:ribonuclease J